jgi:chromosome partitioning protein
MSPTTDLPTGKEDRTVRSLAIVNLKGGSGKTTSALCLSVGLAQRGYRSLAIDGDPQSNASMTLLDGESGEPPTLGHVLLDEADIKEAIRPTRIRGLDVLPSDAQLADAALLLADRLGRERRLRPALQAISADYDFVVVDAAPQLNLVTINILNAVDELIVPVDAGLYSVAGLSRLQETVEQVRRYLDNPRLKIGGLLMTRTHNNRATRDIADQLRAAFGNLVYREMIPHSVRVEEAHARHRSVIEFAPDSTPAKAYNAFIEEVLNNGQGQQQPGRSSTLPGVDSPEAA